MGVRKEDVETNVQTVNSVHMEDTSIRPTSDRDREVRKERGYQEKGNVGPYNQKEGEPITIFLEADSLTAKLAPSRRVKKGEGSSSIERGIIGSKFHQEGSTMPPKKMACPRWGGRESQGGGEMKREQTQNV